MADMSFGPPGGGFGGPPGGGGGGFGGGRGGRGGNGGGFGGIGQAGGIGLWSLFAAMFTRSNAAESLKLLLTGLLIEFGRRIFNWAQERIVLRMSYLPYPIESFNLCVSAGPSASAIFQEGDPSYEWVMHFLVCFVLFIYSLL
jgi:hypothetical protein